MSNRAKTYFIAPSFDWTAEDSSVRLGAIITDPSYPDEPISSESSIVPGIHKSEQRNWTDEKTRSHDSSIGIWAKFAGALPLGGSAGAEYGKNKVDKYQFEKLETQYFDPDRAYVEKRVMEPAVQQYLKSKKYRKQVYMITGLKIAHNPAAASLVTTSLTTHAGVEGDLTTVSIPISVGAGGQVTRERGSATSFSGGSNFIFAFRLREITYKSVKEKAKIDSKTLTGGWYGIGDRKVVEDEGDVVEKFRFLGLTDEDVNADDLQMTPEPVLDGEEVCEGVVISRPSGLAT